MDVTRRDVVLATCATAAAMACGCATGGTTAPPPPATGPVDLGPATEFAADGVYDRSRTAGVFVLRRGGRITALSAVCTHRKCLLRAEPDHTFKCKCHGSTFDADGEVTKGPATRDLPTLPLTTAADGHLIVARPA